MLLTAAQLAEHRETLTAALLADDPAPPLWHLVDSGLADEIVPELPALRLEQDPIHRHKDVLAHTIAVVAKTRADLTLRLATLFHDVGKPRTRSYERGTVTFYHHEAVGARMTRKRLIELGYPEQVVDDVSELVRLSGRFKGYADGWSDAAVRRYAREAGPLLGYLNELVRADCTTRNRQEGRRSPAPRGPSGGPHRPTGRGGAPGGRAAADRWQRGDGALRHRPRPRGGSSAQIPLGSEAVRARVGSGRYRGPTRRLVGRKGINTQVRD